MNWFEYPLNGLNVLLRTSNQFTYHAPNSFTLFLQTLSERCSIVREKLEGCSIEMRGGFPDWERVGEWFIEEVLAETNAVVNSQKVVALEERWQSFCVDLATLLGEQIISRSSSVDWEYHVGSPQMWPANEVVLRSRNDPDFVGMPVLSAFYATRMRSLHLNDPNGPLGEARPVSVRKQDIASEKLTFQEIFKHAEKRFIQDNSDWTSQIDTTSLQLVDSLGLETTLKKAVDEPIVKLHTAIGSEGQTTWEWRRDAKDERRGISFYSDETMDYWLVWINAAESVRDHESYFKLQDVVKRALINIEGVERVVPEDRETWLVFGNVSGGGAVSAIGDVIDTYLKSEIVKY